MQNSVRKFFLACSFNGRMFPNVNRGGYSTNPVHKRQSDR